MINVTADQIDRVEKALADLPGAAGRAMSRALNRVATSSRAEAVRRIGETYAAKAGDVRRMIKLTMSTPESLAIDITARGAPLSLGYFPHTPKRVGTGGKGKPPLRAEIKKGERKPVPDSFLATINGKPRVMHRTGGKTATGRTAIASTYTIALGQMLGVPRVRLQVEARALEVLDQRLDREIDRELARAS